MPAVYAGFLKATAVGIIASRVKRLPRDLSPKLFSGMRMYDHKN
jgi:hypothetical protein